MSASAPSAIGRLIETKLMQPRARSGVIERARLTAKLDDLSGAALTLIVAPVGFGKTVLAQEWCRRQEAAVAWVSVDSADEDPARLWTYIATALDRVSPGLGAPALARLRAPGAQTVKAVDDLVNGLAEYGADVVLVLDDLHEIQDEECLAGLFHLADRLPPSARILATARHDPPMRLGRLRASRLLGEVRASDLAFTAAEARALLVEVEGVPLGDDEIASLVERTEGWPAGLYLAALWLRGVDRPAEAVRTFGGDNRQVADYLAGEVLDGLGEEQRAFLTQAAVLDRFSSVMCDAVLGRADSAAMLADLERSNVFLVRLDARREWFRFHHLFRDLLRLHLQLVDPTVPAEIRQRACAWCVEQGLVEEALEYAQAVGDSATVIALLRRHQSELLRTARAGTLIRWLTRIPADVMLDEPELAAGAALVSGVVRRPTLERRRFLAMADRARDERPHSWTPYATAIVGLTRGGWIADDVGAAIASARAALEVDRPDEDVTTVGALAFLSYGEFLAGDLTAAAASAHAAMAHPTSPDRPHGVMIALAVLALIELERGSGRAAAQLAEQALATTRAVGLEETWTAGIVHVALAGCALAEERLGDAERHAEQAEELRRETLPCITHAHALLVLAHVRAARHRWARARTDLALAREGIDDAADAGRLVELAAAVERLIDRGEREPTPAVVEGPTDAELNVLRLLPTALSQREIGAALFVSHNTVKSHTRELYRKLGAASRAEAVERARDLGILEDETAAG